MKVLLYATAENPYGKRLCELISQEFSMDSMTLADTLEQLVVVLKSPAFRPDCVLLMVADSAELSRLLSVRMLLHEVQIILVLPPAGDDLVVEAHLLRPRFLTFADSDPDDLIAVLRRLRIRTQSRNLCGALATESALFPDPTQRPS